MVAIKEGGSDPDNNNRLKLAIERARTSNMPKDNIQKLLKKADNNSTS
jgi:transcriptional/translational regulatory protein YebC/TACO1